MPCPSVLSGDRFLATALAHIDCQAQTIGSYGWGALADTGSPVSIAMTGLLTIFVAIFGIRLVLDYPVSQHDVVGDVLKVGIVLTLATSWSAWRIVGFDLLIDGPIQIAKSLGLAAGLPGGGGDLIARLQNVDQGIASLNVFGTGRLGTSQGDWLQLGITRLAFLSGSLVPLAIVRLSAGILLAIAPLMAGLLLFSASRGIFEGWLRGLAAVFLASVAITTVLGVELALLEPWLMDALQRRAGEEQVLDAPVEALAMTGGFALVALSLIAISFRIAFYSRVERPSVADRSPTIVADGSASNTSHTRLVGNDLSRARTVSHSIEQGLRREERLSTSARQMPQFESAVQTGGAVRAGEPSSDARLGTLGQTWRRPSRRQSTTQRQRDQQL